MPLKTLRIYIFISFRISQFPFILSVTIFLHFHITYYELLDFLYLRNHRCLRLSLLKFKQNTCIRIVPILFDYTFLIIIMILLMTQIIKLMSLKSNINLHM